MEGRPLEEGLAERDEEDVWMLRDAEEQLEKPSEPLTLLFIQAGGCV